MNRQQYMKKLQSLLLWKYSAAEAKEILEDYTEFFETGQEQGKREEEICLELGAPIEVVRSLESESRCGRWNRRVILRNILAAGLFLFSVWLIHSVGAGANVIGLNIILEPFVVTAVWFLLGGRNFSLEWLGTREKSCKTFRTGRLLHLVPAVLILLTAGVFLLFGFQPDMVTGRLGLRPEQMGPVFHCFLCICMIPAAAVCVWSIDHFRRDRICYYGLFCHGSGALMALFSWINLLGVLTDTGSKLLVQMAVCLAPYAEAVLAAVLFGCLLPGGKQLPSGAGSTAGIEEEFPEVK